MLAISSGFDDEEWKSTFFSTSSKNDVATQINNVRSYVFLGKYLNKEANKSDYITLLNNGLSPDFVARITLHDMCFPQQRLAPQLLSHEPNDAHLIDNLEECDFNPSFSH
jgi:hypothetical protein